MTSPDRESFLKKQAAEDLFRNRTILMEDLLSPGRNASHRSIQDDADFPKMRPPQRSNTGISGIAWQNIPPAVRQLSSLGNSVSAPKYYPLGLWQHQRPKEFSELQKTGLVAAPYHRHGPRRTTQRLRSPQRKSGGLKRKDTNLPPLSISKAPSYKYRTSARSNNGGLKTSSAKKTPNDSDSLRSSSIFDSQEVTPERLAPWEKRRLERLEQENQTNVTQDHEEDYNTATEIHLLESNGTAASADVGDTWNPRLSFVADEQNAFRSDEGFHDTTNEDQLTSSLTPNGERHSAKLSDSGTEHTKVRKEPPPLMRRHHVKDFSDKLPKLNPEDAATDNDSHSDKEVEESQEALYDSTEELRGKYEASQSIRDLAKQIVGQAMSGAFRSYQKLAAIKHKNSEELSQPDSVAETRVDNSSSVPLPPIKTL